MYMFGNNWKSHFCILQNIYLSNNNVDFIHRFAFNGLKTLYILDISNNRLTSAPLLEQVGSTLRKLNLKRNYIKQVEDSYFNLFKNIVHINVGHNELTQFPSVQNIAKTIVAFELEGNNISNANFVHGTTFPKLTFLNLQSNQIGMFCPPPIKFAPRLSFLNLQSNKLSMIDFPRESNWQEVTALLHDNPWHCNGSLGWTRQCDVRDKDLNILVCWKWLLLRGMICDSPVEVQGMAPKEAATSKYYLINWSLWDEAIIFKV